MAPQITSPSERNFARERAAAATPSAIDLHSVARARRLVLHIKTGLAINLPRRRLNNRCEYDVKYESRYVEMGRSCDKKGCASMRVCVGTACIYYTYSCAFVCREKKKKRTCPPHPRAIKLNMRGGEERLLFVRVSLLMDASHKTSTIRDHSSSFLPLLTPPLCIIFYSPSLTPTPSNPTRPHPRFLCWRW